MEIPKVSIILPCYNVEFYLRRCIKSILSSDYDNYEILLVNDGSTDKTGEIILELESVDCRIHGFEKSNAGVSSARNFGIMKSSGKYIFFVDPDDEVYSNMISVVVGAMEKHNADYCVFDFDVVGQKNSSVLMNTKLNKDYRCNSTKKIIRDFFPTLFGYSLKDVDNLYRGEKINRDKEFGSVWHCAYKRSIIVENNIKMDETIILNEDSMFNCEYMMYATNLITIRKSLYRYYLKVQGAMESNVHNRKMLINKYRLLKKREQIAKIYQKKGYGDAENMYIGSCVFSILEMMNQVAQNKKGNNDFWLIKKYYSEPIVQKAIYKFPLGRKMKVAIPALLLKWHMLYPLFMIFRFSKFLGIKIST